ncbi:MAG TPA: type II secretion system protein [Gammaproteobacteria bacterium]
MRGFTFVELVISVVVIGIAVAGVLLIFTTTVSRSADPLVRQQALAIAESYLEEVIAKHYDDPNGGETFGAEGGEARASYDDVWDYDGLSGAPTRPYGAPAAIAELAGYTVTVDVSDGTAALGVTAARVDVTVSHGGSNVVSLWSFRADYSP